MISIVIPTYNRRVLLARAIDSVLKQTLQAFEVIVVDDGSTDGTEVLFTETYSDPRIRYDRLQENQGVHKARNRGIDLARGEYLTFLDSDDELMSHALATVVAPMKESTIGMVMAPYRLSDGELTGFNREEDGELAFEDLLCARDVRASKVYFVALRRSTVGNIRWSVKYLQFLFFRYVGIKTRIYYSAEPVAIYHKGSDSHSVSTLRNKADSALSIERAVALSKFLDDFGSQILTHCPQRYGYYGYGAAVGLLLAGDVDKARHLARESMRLQMRPRYVFFYIFTLMPFSSKLLAGLFSLKALVQKIR